jgi:hypothetical protein
VASKIAAKIALPRTGSKMTGDGTGEEASVASPTSDFLFKQPDTLPPREAPPPQYDPSGTIPLAAAAHAESLEEGDRERSNSKKK